MDDNEKEDLEAQHVEHVEHVDNITPQAYLDLAAADSQYTTAAQAHATAKTAFESAKDTLKQAETALSAAVTARKQARKDILDQAPGYKARRVLRAALEANDKDEPDLNLPNVNTTSKKKGDGGTVFLCFLTVLAVIAVVVLFLAGHYAPERTCQISRSLAKAYNYAFIAILLAIPVFFIGLILATNTVSASLAKSRPKRHALVAFLSVLTVLYLAGAAAIPERMNNIIIFEPFCHKNEWIDVYDYPGHPGWEGNLEKQRTNATASRETKERIRMWDESELARNISRMYRESKGWSFGDRDVW